jgi:glycosyltransferase involved in cell wall biosynthesis
MDNLSDTIEDDTHTPYSSLIIENFLKNESDPLSYKSPASYKTSISTSLIKSVKQILSKLYWGLFPFFKYSIFHLSLGKRLEEWHPDAIHAHDLATLPAAIKNATKLNSKVIYDAHEMEQYRNPPLNTFQRKWVKHIERKYGKLADQVITVSPPIAEFLQDELSKDIALIYNSPELEKGESTSDIRADTGVDENSPLLIYVGGIFINRGIEKLFEALVPLDDFHLALVGPARDSVIYDLIEYAKELGVIDRVHIVNPVAAHLVVDYIKTADIGVYAIRNICKSYDYSMPNKLFEMTFAGLPIAVSNLSAVRAFLAETKNGITFDETKTDDIEISIRELWKNRNIFKLSSKRISQIYDKYGWPVQAERLVNIYSALVEN